MAQSELWSTAKLAVRAYAHDPSQKNSVKVALAWKAIRDHDALANEQRMLERSVVAGKQTASLGQRKEGERA